MRGLIKEMVYGMEQRSFVSEQQLMSAKLKIDSVGKDETYIAYLLTPYSTVLLEKLTGSAASQEIPLIFGTLKFIAVLTSARHLSLS